MPIYTRRDDWGGNSISRELYGWIESYLPVDKTILELGSGWGTSKLMEKWNVWSIEHNEDWFKKYNPQSFLVHMSAPKEDGWYEREALKKALDGLEYDLLLIDGPWYGRQHFPEHLDLFDTRVPMVFDDVSREMGMKVIRTVSTMVGREYLIIGGGRSIFGVIPDAVEG